MNELLSKSISLLAATSTAQREWLKESGSFPSTDEIALLFDDCYNGLSVDSDIGLSSSIFNKLKKINTLLDAASFPNESDTWSEKSLDYQPWTEIRMLAISILEEGIGGNESK
ncbi:MAG: hypothetical protein V4592_04780 [Bacteroidota bacterium]